jgi:dTMP kinase
MSGRFVVIEAVDLAGKTTQLALLQEALERRGLRVGVISYPDRDAPETGGRISEFLAGRLALVDDPTGDPIGQMLAGQRLFSLNRREVAPRLARLLDDHDIVVASRYALSARAYARAGGVDGRAIDELHEQLESDLQRPDLTIVLDLDPDGLEGRPRDGGLDTFEADRGLQRRVRDAYRELAALDPSIVLVDASGDAGSVHRHVVEALDCVLGAAASEE